MSDTPHVEASGERAVAVGVNQGIMATGDHAAIDARTVHLPAEAFRPADVPAPHGITNLPAPANPDFVDRTEPLAHLEAALREGRPAPPVIHGLGGTGKSALALHVAHRQRDRFNPVWWVTADTASNITQGLADLAARLAPQQQIAGMTSVESAEWAVSWLQAHHGWLLVLDDAASPRDVAGVLGMTTGRHIITSRRATGWRRLAEPVALDTLPSDAAVEMLMRIIEPDGPEDEAALTSLADELGSLPLALEQAAAYIEATAISPQTYLERLRRYPGRMFAATAAAGHEENNGRTIARIWHLSLQAITEQQPLAAELLRLFAWLSSTPLPRDVLDSVHQDLGADSIAVDEALALLHSFSMITLTRQTVAVHRLVQAVARTPDRADPHRQADAIRSARERAVLLLERALPENPLFNVPSWPRWRELLPHLLALTSRTAGDEEDIHVAGLLLAASGFLQGDGQTALSVTCAQHALDVYTRLHGPDHPATLAAGSFLASAYRAAGDLQAATPLHQKNLADHERLYGPGHPDTLVARANLAYLYALQGEPGRARDLHQRNLADLERLHGADHPHTINARANLASAHRDLGDLDQAVTLHRQAVADYARVYGSDHSETITARSNLAYALQLADALEAALPLYERVLADRERLYGPDHPHTDLARQLLAHAREAQNRHHS